MERIARGVYTEEFREQAVKLVQAEGLSMRDAARRLSMPEGSLKNWLQAARAGKLKKVGKTQKPLSDLEPEQVRTKKELAQLKQERDLLKELRAVDDCSGHDKFRIPERRHRPWKWQQTGLRRLPSAAGIRFFAKLPLDTKMLIVGTESTE